MQLIITDPRLSKSYVLQIKGPALAATLVALFLTVTLISAGIYHWILLKGARDGWPIISSVMRLVVKDEFDQRDRYMRENIELMAKRMGEMQAKLLQMESLAERVSGLAGLDPAAFKVPPGQGGALVLGRDLTMQELQSTLHQIEQTTGQRNDLMTVIESRLFEQKIKKMMIPTRSPVPDATAGSAFGWRIDPFTGLSAMHDGLDFPAVVGTPVYSAAGGVVVSQELHPQYGNMVEVDHGDSLLTRYAHLSRSVVKKGDLIKRGQKIAEVGNTGRSTGPHLHFEVLVRGVAQDPQKFLRMGASTPSRTAQR
ncbi:MAG: M23 family metallopeptidase [Rhodoferax sp.]|nr:M23 family metallopeptidase [Rhodoferax sp.]